jgi:C_GCAxxG_C_C family probable redox protein
VAESKHIQSEWIPKIATGFCGGISRTCGICGAVSGAVMAINMFFGRNEPGESVEKNYALVKKLVDIFEKEFGSINCKELIGCDLGTKEGQHRFMSGDLITRCKHMTEGATRIAMSIIEDES